MKAPRPSCRRTFPPRLEKNHYRGGRKEYRAIVTKTIEPDSLGNSRHLELAVTREQIVKSLLAKGSKAPDHVHPLDAGNAVVRKDGANDSWHITDVCEETKLAIEQLEIGEFAPKEGASAFRDFIE